MDVFSGIATVIISAGVGALWRLDKRHAAIEARVEIVLEQIVALRTDHKERLDDHELRLRVLEKNH